MALERRSGNNNCIPITGIAYVIIPRGCNVSEYVSKCYRNNTLSINLGLGGTPMHNVKVADGVMEKIRFPLNGETNGTAVVWIRENVYNKPVVIATIPEGGVANVLSNGQQRMMQEKNGRLSEVFVDGQNGEVHVSAVGDYTKSARVSIKAISKRGIGDAVDIESNNEVNIQGETLNTVLTDAYEFTINNGLMDEEGNPLDIVKIHIDADGVRFNDHFGNNVTLNEEKCEFVDQWNNKIVSNAEEVHLTEAHGNEAIFNEEHTQLLCNKFDVGSGEEQMVLGNTLVSLLSELITQITKLTVVTHVGASGTPINAAAFTSIKNKLDTALSKLSNTD